MPSSHPSPLIGRTAELQTLTRALDRSGKGAGRTLLIAGAMGMGRSRLAQELAALAQRRGHLVLAGRAYPLDQNLPYAPIITSLGPYLRGLEPLRQAELLEGLPNLRLLVGGLSAAEGELYQVHLFEEVVRLAERLAEARPLLWCLDDLHLADPASVALFYYLARNVQGRRILLLATYRNDDSDALRRLAVPLLTLARHGFSEEVQLRRLTPEDLAVLTRERLNGIPSHRLLDHLEARSMGTPLIALSLLDSLQSDGLLTRTGGVVGLSPAAAQRTTSPNQSIILDRLAPLSPGERQVLNLLAAAGGTAKQRELARAMDQEPAALLAPLAALQASGLIIAAETAEGLDVQVALCHPFLREVLCAELPSLVLRQHHAQLAAALESAAPVPLDRLARHYQGSGGEPNPERAVEVMMTAGEAALLTGGSEPVDLFRMALALVRCRLLPERLPAALLGLARALSLSGQFREARDCLREALDDCEQRGDQRGAGAMQMHLAYIAVMLGDLERTEAHLTGGLACFPAGGSDPELAHLYGLRFNLHLLRTEIALLPGDIADLARSARLLGTPAARAWHLHARTWGELLSGQVETAQSTAREGLHEAWLSADPNLVILTVLDYAHIFMIRGEHRAAAVELRAALDRTPPGYLLVAQHALGPMLAMAEFMGGNWESALRVTDQSLPLEPFFQGLPRANLGARGTILIRRGDLAGARACLDEASRFPRPFVTDADHAEALLALESGQVEQAAALAGRLFTWSLAPLGIALLGEAQAALGDAVGAHHQAALLSGMGSLNLPLAGALSAWVTGLAHRTAAETDSAIAAFASATEQFERLAMPFDAARARFEQAQLTAAADRQAAVELGRRSLQAFARLGADLWTDRARRWLSGSAPRAKGVRPRPAAAFSARELEILRLIDQGLTNGEIAVSLVLSPRTVANHLDRIYTRHGVRNRTSLVRFARNAGYLT